MSSRFLTLQRGPLRQLLNNNHQRIRTQSLSAASSSTRSFLTLSSSTSSYPVRTNGSINVNLVAGRSETTRKRVMGRTSPDVLGRRFATAVGATAVDASRGSGGVAVGGASFAEELDTIRKGGVFHGFKVLKVKDVPDFNLTAVQLCHEKTGANYLHVYKEDSNNLFMIAFKTAPQDSTGVPHILEHTTLCGSQKFPVRDPFFKMLNRSMATFMNAMTGSDVTMYPFSTENQVDFDNLFEVYMDSVFRPLLRREDFNQEGWRLEHEAPTDRTSPIIFKGVVYNEMKGVFSDVNNIFLQRLQQAIYPGTTYGYVSGGDPVNIPDLTYEGLVDFHKKNYHPSNSMFVSYGNFPLLSRLQAVDEKISMFEKIGVETISDVEVFDSPKRILQYGPPDPMGDSNKQTRMSVSYLTNDGTDAFETFAMRMITSLLIDGPSSPMYRSLIESNLGSDYAASTGYDRTSRQTSFSVGLQGIRKEDVEVVEGMIEGVFKSVVEEFSGFEEHRVESAIHQLELGIRHRRANFGMGLAQSAVQNWIHGGDAVESLEVTKHIARLREEFKDPEFVKSRVRKYFLENKHRVLFVMEPKEDFSAQVEAEEYERLQTKVKALTDSDREKIYLDGVKLLEMQEKKEDPSCLPTLTLNDVAKTGKTYAVSIKDTKGGVPVQYRETDTNGLSYVTLSRSLEGFDKELLPYLPLYCSSLSALGTKKTPSVPDLDDKIRSATSGISAFSNLATSPISLSTTSHNLHISTSSITTQHLSKSYDLLSELIEGLDFNNAIKQGPGSEVFERLKTVVGSAAAGGMSSLADSGHRYAMGVAASGVSGTARAISDFIRNGASSTKAAVVTSKDGLSANENKLSGLFDEFKWKMASGNASSQAFNKEFANTFIPLPFTVNYAARVFPTVAYNHADGASLQVLAELMTSHFLHKEIREKGGAYGAFANYNPTDGLFSMMSYRDPPGAGVRTMGAFDRAVQWALEVQKHLGQRELDEAKLSILSGLDSPISASEEGMLLFRSGITDELRQTRRDHIFATNYNTLVAVAEKYLLGPSAKALLGPGSEKFADNNWKERPMMENGAGAE
ncbi:Presequence protease, mitochondrial [Blyttiomyces sp. JEL0837]|nr:Presequence protease, mitochondrial [Blyttiomyces sp. JEL0837]